MFVHLRLHTEFSVVDGTTASTRSSKAAAKGWAARLAITDLNNLFGAISPTKEGRGRGQAHSGRRGLPEGEAGAPPARLLLLVQNRQGYLNLSELLARALDAGCREEPAAVYLGLAAGLHAGLIALAGAWPARWARR